MPAKALPSVSCSAKPTIAATIAEPARKSRLDTWNANTAATTTQDDDDRVLDDRRRAIGDLIVGPRVEQRG